MHVCKGKYLQKILSCFTKFGLNPFKQAKLVAKTFNKAKCCLIYLMHNISKKKHTGLPNKLESGTIAPLEHVNLHASITRLDIVYHSSFHLLVCSAC
jgi:hypothetical protein